jgi:hypothetical protein
MARVRILLRFGVFPYIPYDFFVFFFSVLADRDFASSRPTQSYRVPLRTQSRGLKKK